MRLKQFNFFSFEKIFPLTPLLIYPTLFMLPALNPLNETMMGGEGNTDPAFGMWNFQMLEKMPTPWSTNFLVNAPNGETFWKLSTLVNGLFWLFAWLQTRIISPMLALNITIWFGWVSSGIAAYFLAKHIGASKSGSLFSGVAVQFLPWLREKVLTHFEYTYFGIPLICTLLGIRWVEEPTKKRFFQCCLFLFTVFFISLYWFYMCSFILFVLLLLQKKAIIRLAKRINKRSGIFLCVTLCLGAYFLLQIYTYLNRSTVKNPIWERPLTIATRDEIDLFNKPLTYFVRTPSSHLLFPSKVPIGKGTLEDTVNYAGVVVIVFALIAVLYALTKHRKLNFTHLKTLGVIAMAASLITLQTNQGIFSIPVVLIRNVMPGARVFSRFGIISETLICIIAGLGFSVVLSWVKAKNIKIVVGFICFVLLVVDFNPFARRVFDNDFSSFHEIRKALGKIEDPVTFVFGLDQTPWVPPLSYIDNKTLFTWREQIQNYPEVFLFASRGPLELASYLRSRSVTNLVVPMQSDGSYRIFHKFGGRASINMNLDERYFIRIASAGGKYPAALFGIRNDFLSSYCKSCRPYEVVWSGVNPNFYRFLWNSGISQRQYFDGPEISWVRPNEEPKFYIKDNSEKKNTYRVTLKLNAAFGPLAQPQVLIIRSSSYRKIILLTPGAPNPVTFTISDGEPVSLSNYLPCTRVNDFEIYSQLCYGISNLEIYELR
jgi:hypothetical protein